MPLSCDTPRSAPPVRAPRRGAGDVALFARYQRDRDAPGREAIVAR